MIYWDVYFIFNLGLSFIKNFNILYIIININYNYGLIYDEIDVKFEYKYLILIE